MVKAYPLDLVLEFSFDASVTEDSEDVVMVVASSEVSAMLPVPEAIYQVGSGQLNFKLSECGCLVVVQSDIEFDFEVRDRAPAQNPSGFGRPCYGVRLAEKRAERDVKRATRNRRSVGLFVWLGQAASCLLRRGCQPVSALSCHVGDEVIK